VSYSKKSKVFTYPRWFATIFDKDTLRMFGRCYDPPVGEGSPYSSVKLLSDYLNLSDHNPIHHVQVTDGRTTFS